MRSFRLDPLSPLLERVDVVVLETEGWTVALGAMRCVVSDVDVWGI
jgi:hypothetical protein